MMVFQNSLHVHRWNNFLSWWHVWVRINTQHPRRSIPIEVVHLLLRHPHQRRASEVTSPHDLSWWCDCLASSDTIGMDRWHTKSSTIHPDRGSASLATPSISMPGKRGYEPSWSVLVVWLLGIVWHEQDGSAAAATRCAWCLYSVDFIPLQRTGICPSVP
jgi:hypothetical protein